jgi:hypothetical protein
VTGSGRRRAATSPAAEALPGERPAQPAAGLFREAARVAHHAPDTLQIRLASGYVLALVGASMALAVTLFFTFAGVTRIMIPGRLEADGPRLRAILLAPADAARLIRAGDALSLQDRRCTRAACPQRVAYVTSVSHVPDDRASDACDREAAEYRVIAQLDPVGEAASRTARTDAVQVELPLAHRRPLYRWLLANLACRPDSR